MAAWHLRPVSPREEHQFFNLTDLFRWFRDWSRAVPELATPEVSTLEQLLDDAEAELASFVRADTAAETLASLRARILKLGQASLKRAASMGGANEQLLVSSAASGEAAFVRRFGDAPDLASGKISALLEDSVARLEFAAPALLVRRETQALLEAELLHWSPILRAEPALQPLLERWLTGYFAKFRPLAIRLSAPVDPATGVRLVAASP